MVKLDKIEDEEVVNGSTIIKEEQQPIVESESEGEESESDSDIDDDFNENETIIERIQALGDIFSPRQKEIVFNSFNFTTSSFNKLLSKAGSGLWILTTSALLIGVPIAAGILGETQLMELEKEFNQQQNAAGLAPASVDPLLQSDEEKK